MCRHQCKESRIVKTQVTVTLLKGINKVLISGPKEMEIYKLTKNLEEIS